MRYNYEMNTNKDTNKTNAAQPLRLLLSCFLGIAMAMGVLTACQDNESFTTSTANLLTFSTDTVKLDTTFSTVPTATKTFWVYNRSGAGIRCRNVRLEQGNQTGYRVNVDGQYLGATEGFQTNDVELREGDSIRVFVELTSPVNSQDKPQLVSDNLIFTLESNVQQKVNLRAFSWDADLIDNLTVSSDYTIDSSRPIIVRGGITVEEGATLTINAGNTLYFHNDAGINVHGTLVTQGTTEENVVLRGDRIDHMFDYLPYDRVSGQWQGVHFYKSSYNNRLDNTDIHSTFNGVVCDSSLCDKPKLTMTNSTIHNCQGYGLLAQHSVVDMLNTQVSNTLKDCVAIYGGVVRMRHCTLAQFYPFDGARGMALRFSNKLNGYDYKLYECDITNTIVTGYADDVISGELDKDVAASYLFTNCLLRTPSDTGNAECFKDVIFEDVKDTESSGDKNFALIDTDNLIYDFRLSDKSKAIDAATKLADSDCEYDRLGVARGEKPDIGAYEYVAPPEEE